ncbi:MAG: small subunit ribosomal protein, partial [Actinomycetota bacterium]|nr:small subunit ribosomal protein [Actinomycetota bacterium]
MAKIEDTIDEAPEGTDASGSYTTETGDTSSFTTESTPTEAPKAPRTILNVPGAAVGRRKEAIARVRITP